MGGDTGILQGVGRPTGDSDSDSDSDHWEVI